MPRTRVSAAATGLPSAILYEIHDMLTLAMDASERTSGYSDAERETRSYIRTAMRRVGRIMEGVV